MDSIVPVLDKLRLIVMLGRIANEVFQTRMADLLQSLGDAEFNLAMQALRDASKSPMPSREQGMALDRFERAHYNYSQAAKKGSENILREMWAPKKILQSQRGALVSLSFVVTTYRQFENQPLMIQYAQMFRKEFLEYYSSVFYYHNGRTITNNREAILNANKEELKAIEFLKLHNIEAWTPKQNEYQELDLGPSQNTRDILRKW